MNFFKRYLYAFLSVCCVLSLCACSRQSALHEKGFVTGTPENPYFINGEFIFQKDGDTLNPIVETEIGGYDLEEADGKLFFINLDHALCSYDKKTKAISVLLEDYVREIAYDSGTLYARTEDALLSIDLKTGAIEPLLSQTIHCWGVADGKLYYVLPNTKELYCCTVKNGATQLLANNASNLDLEISDEILYYIAENGAIAGINLKTSKQTFHSDPVGATKLAADREILCYSPGQPGQTDEIYRMKLTDGTSEKIWDGGALDFTTFNGKVYVMADDLGNHGFLEIDESGTQKILEITNAAN